MVVAHLATNLTPHLTHSERAESLLFHIETRVARHAAHSHHGLHQFISDHSARRDRHAVLEARARGVRSPVRPSVQEMERFAPEWRYLVPHDPGIRAAMAHRLALDYRFTYEAIPRIRAALGLDDEDVKQTYEHMFGSPLQRVYVHRLGSLDRVHWFWSGVAQRLEALPPFWTAYSLTLTETVGATILALPIAVVGVGPIPGVVLLILIGLVNMLTVGFMSEAVTRSGAIRYGTGYIGQLVADYLGSLGSGVLTTALFGLCSLVLLSYYIGLSSVLQDSTRIPAPAWAALLFLVGIYFVSRGKLNATIASALVVGALNIGIILGLSALALTQFSSARLMRMDLPFAGGRPFDPSILGAIFGVILTAYFGHLSVANCGKVVLQRDPTGRSLIWGNIAAQATATFLYCIFVLAVSGAVGPQALVGQTGTSLEPLAAQVGPVASVLGSVFVVLGIGMASVHFSLGLFNLVRERLPSSPAVVGDSHGNSSNGRPRSFGRIGSIKELELLASGRHARFLIEISPLVLILILAEWSLITHALSFTSLLGFLGIIFIPLLAGIFPVLLIGASRKKGEYVPTSVYQTLGNPVLLGLVYAIFLASFVVHGLLIWSDLGERILALSIGLLLLAMTVGLMRRGIFASRTVVEVRASQSPPSTGIVALSSGGHPTTAKIWLGYAGQEPCVQEVDGTAAVMPSLRTLTLDLPNGTSQELKVWAHRVTPEGDSEPIGGQVKLACDPADSHGVRELRNGEILLCLPAGSCCVAIGLE